MLVFVIPLKSRATSRSWPQTCRLFERTLRSVCNQTSAAFRVLVVCHDRPAIGFSHPAVEYLHVDFPPAGNDPDGAFLDRRRKEIVGLLATRRWGNCYVLKVDADDCVSNRLASFVDSEPVAHGWCFESGYLHYEGGQQLRLKTHGFHRWCGTCTIVRAHCYELLRIPIADIPTDAEAIDTLADTYYVKHRYFVRWMRAHGIPLNPLPFPAAIYTLAHSENSGRKDPKDLFLSPWLARRLYQRAFRMHPITPELRAEFGLYDLDQEE